MDTCLSIHAGESSPDQSITQSTAVSSASIGTEGSDSSFINQPSPDSSVGNPWALASGSPGETEPVSTVSMVEPAASGFFADPAPPAGTVSIEEGAEPDVSTIKTKKVGLLKVFDCALQCSSIPTYGSSC